MTSTSEIAFLIFSSLSKEKEKLSELWDVRSSGIVNTFKIRKKGKFVEFLPRCGHLERERCEAAWPHQRSI